MKLDANMTSFSESALEKKLLELNNSQQSIQTLSLWAIHHRKHWKTIVHVWYRELAKAKVHRKLTFMYLANDVIQNSKKKGPEFTKEFGNLIPKALENISSDGEDKTVKGINRLLQIWQERNVYDSALIEEFRNSFNSGSKESVPASQTVNKAKSPKHKKMKIESPVIVTPVKEEPVASPIKPSPIDPPEVCSPEELIQALMDLENSASSDAAVREKIASLPAEVSDISLLERIQDKEAAEKLSKQVDEACALLDDYNARLSAELEDRKQVARMLTDFAQAQRDALKQAEEKLAEFQSKLHKVNLVRSELKSHIQNLPDLTRLPDVTGGLAPLPSAGDLFNLGEVMH